MKNFKPWPALIVLLVGVCGAVYASNNYEIYKGPTGAVIYNLQDDGSLTLASTFTAIGPLAVGVGNPSNVSAPGSGDIIVGDDVFFGSSTVAITTTSTSGSSQGDIYTAFLASSTGSALSIAALEGSVICSTPSQQGNLVTVIVCPAVSNIGSVVGVSAVAVSTGNTINVYDTGWVLALTTGSVNAGDVLSSSSLSSGYLQISGSTAAVAVALSSGNVNGGLTKVKLLR